MDSLTWALIGGKILGGVFKGISAYQEGQASAESDLYRASLADENAQRADILGLEREERARREGLLDAGLFRMKAEMSGLSGVSAEMWVGQRFLDYHRDIDRARVSRTQTVDRFLKEAKWLRKNATASESSALWSAVGTGISTIADVAHFYENCRVNKGNKR